MGDLAWGSPPKRRPGCPIVQGGVLENHEVALLRWPNAKEQHQATTQKMDQVGVQEFEGGHAQAEGRCRVQARAILQVRK